MNRTGILSSAFHAQGLAHAQEEMHANGADQSDDRFAEWILGNVDRGQYSPEEARTLLAALEREPRFQERARQSREALGGNEWVREHVSGALDPLNLVMLMSGMGPAMMAGAAVESYTAAAIGRFVANRAVRWLGSVGSRIAVESAVLGTHAAAQEAMQTQSLAPINLQNIETHAAHNAGVMGVFRGLGGLARPFGVLASGAAQLGGFMALQAHDAPQSEAGFFSRVITAASEMARLRWVSGATNQATGGALHRLESEAAVLRERPQATSGSELAQGARAFGRQLALAPLGWVLGIPTEGGIPSDAADNPMNRVTDAVAAGALSRERAMELVVAHLENAAARVGPDVLNAANAALETPYYRPSRSQILQNLWDRIGDGARLRLLRGFPPLTLSTSEDFMLLQSLARFIRSQGGVLETESGYRARGGEVSAETIAPGESSPLALADALTQRAADFRTAVVTACASASAPADREAVVASLRTFSDDEINGLPRALSDPVTRENLPPWMTRNATVILEWMEDHGIRIDRAREAHAEEAYRMREHRIYSENFEVDEEGTATVYAHFPVQDIERFVSETGIEGAAATLSSAFTPAMFLTLNPAVLPNILNGPGGNLIPVCTELAANPGHRLLQEGAPVGTLEDRPHLRRVALRVRRDEVNFVNVEGGARRNVIVNRSWDDFQNRPADERLEESWRNQFYVRTSHIDPARIRVVPTYALTPLTLR